MIAKFNSLPVALRVGIIIVVAIGLGVLISGTMGV